MASSSNDRSIKIWNVETGELIVTLKKGEQALEMMTVSADGRVLATLDGERGGMVRLWDLATHKSKPFVQNIRSIRASPDGTLLVTGGMDGVVRLWSAPSWKEIAAFQARGNDIMSLAFSSNSRILAVGTNDGTVIVWNVMARKEEARLKLAARPITSVAIGHDTILAFSDGHTVQLFNVESRKMLAPPKAAFVSTTTLAFSPEGKLLAIGDARQLKFWDLITTKETHVVTEPGFLTCLAFTPDGKRVACSTTRSLRLWSVSDLKNKQQPHTSK